MTHDSFQETAGADQGDPGCPGPEQRGGQWRRHPRRGGDHHPPGLPTVTRLRDDDDCLSCMCQGECPLWRARGAAVPGVAEPDGGGARHRGAEGGQPRAAALPAEAHLASLPPRQGEKYNTITDDSVKDLC